jgi:hypothetical protein
LTALNPDVVVFDLKAVHKESLFSLLENCPKLMLVGISPDNNIVKVWASKQLRDLSTKDLIEVFDSQLKNAPAEIFEGGDVY